jgi:hypothetical protein
VLFAELTGLVCERVIRVLNQWSGCIGDCLPCGCLLSVGPAWHGPSCVDVLLSVGLVTHAGSRHDSLLNLFRM